MQAKIRRHQSILICSGLGVIAFGLWGIIKILALFYFAPGAWSELIDYTDDLLEEQYMKIIILIVVGVVMAADMLFRVYIGKSAIREGKGEKRSIFYVLWTSVYICLSLGGDVSGLKQITADNITDTLASVLIDLTSCFAMLEIIISALALRKIQAAECETDGNKNKGE